MKFYTCSDPSSHKENSETGGNKFNELIEIMTFFEPPEPVSSPVAKLDENEPIEPKIFFEKPTQDTTPPKGLIEIMTFFDPPGQAPSPVTESDQNEPVDPIIHLEKPATEAPANTSVETINRIHKFILNGAKRTVSNVYNSYNQDSVIPANADVYLQKEVSGNVTLSHSGKKVIKPVDTLHKLLSRQYFRIMDECIYYYNGICYEYLPPERAKVLINSLCKDDITVVGNAKHGDNVYDLLMIEEELMIKEDMLPQDTRNYIAFQNGILDLETTRFFAGTPELFIHFQLNCHYMASAHNCPAFDTFLHTITNGDPVLVQRIWETLGYCMTPDFSAKSIVLLQGVSNSGKSQLSNFLTQCFPKQNVTSLGIHEFDKDFTKAELIGKHLCICPDMPSSRLSAITASELKQLTGNDLMTANIKFYPRVKFRNTAKLVCATNHAVRTADDDKTFYDRLVTIPFRYAIPKECMNHNLIQSFLPEMPAIVNRAIDSYRTLKNNNYVFSGYFPPNAPDTIQGGNMNSMEDKLLGLLKKHLVPLKTGVVFADDIQTEFKREYDITMGQNDMKLLKRIMEQVFRSEPSKQRKPGFPKSNPISAYKGYILDSDMAEPVPALV